MAFASVVTHKTVFGNKRIHFGTFDAASVAGGDVDTGLRRCEHISFTHKGSAVQANAPAVNESTPCAGSAVTMVCDSSAVGYWMAVGY
jgi:hypothetical protein